MSQFGARTNVSSNRWHVGYGRSVARRGRPKGGDSSETRRRILDAARGEFAANGFDGASIALIAAHADLAPSAVYHYFGGKVALYEEVFEATAEVVWLDIERAATRHDTLVANVESIVDFVLTMNIERHMYSDFLALFPMECFLHPEFSHLLDWRNKRQEKTFGRLAELGLSTGELDGFDSTTGTELLRSLFMGWFFETHTHGRPHERSGESLITALSLLASRSS